MIGVAAASFVLLVVVFYLIARPFVAQGSPDRADESQALEDRGRVLAQIRDLDMEFATGKLQEDEYHSLRSAREAEAERVEGELVRARAARPSDDDLPLDPGAAGEPADPRSNGHLDAELEEAIAARKRAMKVSACPGCGVPHDQGDRYCRACGRTLEKAETR